MLKVSKNRYYDITKIFIVLVMFLTLAIPMTGLKSNNFKSIFDIRATLTMDDTNDIIIGLDDSYMYSNDKQSWHAARSDTQFLGNQTVYIAKVNGLVDVPLWSSSHGAYSANDKVIYDSELYSARNWTTRTPGDSSGDWIKQSVSQPTIEYTFNFTKASDQEILEKLEKEKLRRRSLRKIFAYVPSWGVYDGHELFDVTKNIDWDGITHLTYSFIKPINQTTNNPTVTWDDAWAALGNGNDVGSNSGNLVGVVPKLRETLAKYKDKYFVFSVGGWSYSEHQEFETATNTQEKIENFAQNLVNWMLEWGFDGIDIDWEYPLTDKDSDQFLALHKAVRERLTAQSLKDEKYYELSCATTPNENNIKYIQPKELIKYVDTINYMSYDYHGGTFFATTSPTNHNAPMYQSAVGDIEPGFNITNVLQKYLDAGVPTNQLMLGMPFYSRSWINVDNQQVVSGLPGLGVTGSNPDPTYSGAGGGTDDSDYGRWGSGSNPYYVMERLLANSSLGYNRYWDSTSQVPYLYSATTKKFHTYDDAQSIQIKVDCLLAHNLAGAIIWDITGDTRPSKGTSGQWTLGNIVKPILGQAVTESDDANITTGSIPNATVGVNYNTIAGTKLSASGKGTIKFSLDSGNPSWISINESGQLSGTPSTTSSSVAIKVIAKGDTGVEAKRTYNISVVGVPEAPIINTTSLPDATATVNYNTVSGSKIGVSSTANSLTFELTTKPSWLSIDSLGQLSGTPTSVSSAETVVVKVTDEYNQTASKSYTITVVKKIDLPIIVNTSLPSVKINTNYNTVSGSKINATGTDTLTYSIKNQSSSNLSIDSTGQLNGSFAVAYLSNSYSITIAVADTYGNSVEKQFGITVTDDTVTTPVPNAPDIITTSLPNGKISIEYSTINGSYISTSGENVRVVLDDSNKPSWMSIEASGQLKGVPNSSGNFSVTVVAIASNVAGDSNETRKTFGLSIEGSGDGGSNNGGDDLDVYLSSNHDIMESHFADVQIVFTNSNAIVSDLKARDLPQGVVLQKTNSDFMLYGYPTKPGVYTIIFDVTLQNSIRGETKRELSAKLVVSKDPTLSNVNTVSGKNTKLIIGLMAGFNLFFIFFVIYIVRKKNKKSQSNRYTTSSRGSNNYNNNRYYRR